MREAPRTQNIERMPKKDRGMYEKDGMWYASADGTNTVPVEDDLAQNIDLALRVQNKVDEALMAGHRPGFLRTIKMLNCRKTIFAVRGTASVDKLINKDLLKSENVSREEIDEASGIPELKNDIEQMLDAGHLPVLGTKEDLQIKEHLDEHPEDLPAVVHVFDIPPRYASRIIAGLMKGTGGLSADDAVTKLHRNHTFLVLGKSEDGSYLCFHKQGPDLYHKFELRDLDSLLQTTVAPVSGRLYISYIGPSDTNENSPAPRPTSAQPLFGV